MSAHLVAVTFEAQNPAVTAGFWARMLGRKVVTESGGSLLLPGDDVQVGLRFARPPDVPTDGPTAAPTGPPRLHLHLTSALPEDQQARVERALELGARHLDLGQRPEEGHVVVADPAGSAFCVIEAGNAFLAGCGLLGEVACDGSREVGLFWSAALGWPLVWDEHEETAVQSPAGGTKLSWGGPPYAVKEARNPHLFDLVSADVDAEVARLLGLGARLVTIEDDIALLADPDGNELSLSAS